MKARVRYALVFTGSTVAGVYVHEIGHAVAGWTFNSKGSRSGLRIPHSLGLDAALRI